MLKTYMILPDPDTITNAEIIFLILTLFSWELLQAGTLHFLGLCCLTSPLEIQIFLLNVSTSLFLMCEAHLWTEAPALSACLKTFSSMLLLRNYLSKHRLTKRSGGRIALFLSPFIISQIFFHP